MKASLIPFNKANVKSGVKVAAYVGAGAVLAQAGSAMLKRASASIASYAAQGPNQEMAVDLGAGLVGAGVGLFALGKLKSPAAARAAAPFVVAGVVVSAAAPVVAPMIASGIDRLVGMVGGGPAPGGYLDNVVPMRRAMPGGLDASYFALPGGVGASTFDVPPAGVSSSSFDVPFGY